MPTAAGITFSIAFLAQKLTPRLGRYTMTLGTIILSIGLAAVVFVLWRSGINATPWEFIPGLFLTGTGMGLVMGLMFSVTLKDVDVKHAGSASGTLNAISQLGGAIGIAIVGVIFFGQLANNASYSFTDKAESNIRTELTAENIPTQAQDSIVTSIKDCYVDRSKQKDASDTPESCKVLESAQSQSGSEKLGEVITSSIKEASNENFTNAFTATMIYAVSLVGVTFLLSFALPKKIVFENVGH